MAKLSRQQITTLARAVEAAIYREDTAVRLRVRYNFAEELEKMFDVDASSFIAEAEAISMLETLFGEQSG